MTISIYTKLYIFLHFKIDSLIAFSIKVEPDLYFKGDIICCYMKCATFQFHVASNYQYNCIILVNVIYLLILVLCVCFIDRCLSFCLLSFFCHSVVCPLRITDSDYPFDIFKLFFQTLVFYVVFCKIIVCPFVLFILDIVLSFLL